MPMIFIASTESLEITCIKHFGSITDIVYDEDGGGSCNVSVYPEARLTVEIRNRDGCLEGKWSLDGRRSGIYAEVMFGPRTVMTIFGSCG